MWHLTQLLNYPDGTEVENTVAPYEEPHELIEHIDRLIERVETKKISSMVLTITHTD